MRSRSVQSSQPRERNQSRPSTVVDRTAPQVTCHLAPSWSVRVSDVRTMRENLNRAQGRGAVPYDDAERLRTVLDAFEDRETEREQITEAVSGLAGAVESLENFDADTLDVSLDVLNDLELSRETRDAIEDALEKSVRAMRTAASLVIAELTSDVKRASEKLDALTEGWGDDS